jgi:hypothetical protein
MADPGLVLAIMDHEQSCIQQTGISCRTILFLHIPPGLPDHLYSSCLLLQFAIISTISAAAAVLLGENLVLNLPG